MLKNLKIGAIQVRVEEDHDLYDVTNDGQHRQLWGVFIEQQGLIVLASEASQSRKQVTLVHEALHGILNNANVADQDEEQITLLAPGIVALLRDNPKLVKYLLK